jgi:redox-sensitive bicupin YhaK (pirin superfamily)
MSKSQIATVVIGQEKELGGFFVRRLLPSAQQRMVGPFIFYDHMGPSTFAPGQGIDVRPHPHIGLATVTYLFEGEILHRDSLGNTQPIRPGEVNWMTAGRGIVHSERTGAQTRAAGHKLHGIQLWVALPVEAEETEPVFFHHPVEDLPVIVQNDVELRLIAGSAFGRQAPVKTYSDMFYLDAELAAGQSVRLPDEHEERALYIAAGAMEIDGQTHKAGSLIVFHSGGEATATAAAASRILMLGGAPFGEGRHIWWNFVSSSRERIEQAKQDWRERRFAPVPGDDREFIPLPE